MELRKRDLYGDLLGKLDRKKAFVLFIGGGALA